MLKRRVRRLEQQPPPASTPGLPAVGIYATREELEAKMNDPAWRHVCMWLPQKDPDPADDGPIPESILAMASDEV